LFILFYITLTNIHSLFTPNFRFTIWLFAVMRYDLNKDT